MTRNQAILAELMKYMDEIKVKICLQNLKLYESELNQLRENIQHSLKFSHRTSFFEKNDVVKSMMKIINVINREIESVEIEMHGVGNYSGYESIRVSDLVLKQSIKDDLNTMLNLIIQARPEIRDAELSGIIKMLG
jgi:hypothetical protein